MEKGFSMLKGETEAMYIETLYDRVEEEYDHELVEKPEYKKLSEECRRIFDELQKGLDPEQREMLFTLEEAMNQSSAYSMEFFFWKGYERGLADEKER